MTGPEDPDTDDLDLFPPEPVEDDAEAIEEDGEPSGGNFA